MFTILPMFLEHVLQKQNEWKKKPGLSEYEPEYVTGKINSSYKSFPTIN